jgi:rubrerythrin
MSDLKGSKTEKNLMEAFAGESQANRRYLAFAKQADAEGYAQVAKLFRAAAESETVHALAHLGVMGGIGSTAENLKQAIGGETYEFKTMYPGMIADAEEEGFAKAKRGFDYANQVEKVHAGLYQRALDSLGKEAEGFDYYVCPVCGYTAEREAPENCPICGTPGKRFARVE